MTVPLLTLFVAVVCGAFGYALGKIHERMDWDKLIRQGKLPRPGFNWRYF